MRVGPCIYLVCTYLGDSISGTCKKFEDLGFWGEWSVGTARANNSATGTCGEPNPVEIPYSISWKTLKIQYQIIMLIIHHHNICIHFILLCWRFMHYIKEVNCTSKWCCLSCKIVYSTSLVVLVLLTVQYLLVSVRTH